MLEERNESLKPGSLLTVSPTCGKLVLGHYWGCAIPNYLM